MAETIENAEGPLPGACAEDQAILEAFLAQRPDKRARRLRLLLLWEGAPTARKALAVKLLNGALSGAEVAGLCEVSDRQLRRYPGYRMFARLLSQHAGGVAGGFKDADGDIEAWDLRG